MGRAQIVWLVVVVGSLMAAVPVTLVRALGSDTGPGVLVVSFAPYAVPAYGLVLAVLLVGWVRFRGREYVGPVIVLVLLMLVVHLAWLRPLVDGPTAGAAPQKGSFTVMTSNVLFSGAEPDDLVRIVDEHRVDVLTLQEVDEGLVAALDARGLADRFPHRAGEASGGAVGTVVLSRFPLRGDEDLGMNLGSVRTVVRAPAGRFTLIAAHPTRPGLRGSAGWAADHDRLLEAVRGERGTLVLAGDLNATPDHAQYRRLLDSGLRDSVAATNGGWSPTWPSDGRVSVLGIPVPPLIAIDHVLVGEGVAVHGARAVSVPGSDHKAVIVTLSTPPAG